MELPASRATPESDEFYAVADFTSELIANVARDHYRVAAWWTLLSRSWDRSLEDIRAVPSRFRSSARWAVLGAALGAGVIFLAAAFQSRTVTLHGAALWLPWYAVSVFFLLTHLGMVDDRDGRPHAHLQLPNGLSFLRLGLAPLVMWLLLSTPVDPAVAPVFAAFLLALALSDLVDGSLARRSGRTTRMGRMLDPMADMALATFLATGLLTAGVLPVALFVLLMIRYPGALIGVLLLYFARGPMPIRPTAVVRVTALVSNIVLVTAALALLLQPEWLATKWFDWSWSILYLVVVVNLVHLVRRAVRWQHVVERLSS